jgi:formylglycine-generating enzyme required for sulfatase activity
MERWAAASVLCFCLGEGIAVSPGEVEIPDVSELAFIRGDASADGFLTITDPLAVLNRLFIARASSILCMDAADANDDGTINLSDPVFLLGHLFLGSAPPPRPYPQCGVDGTFDAIDCGRYSPCARPQVYVNSIGVRFVYIPPGSFIMGSPETERSREPHACNRRTPPPPWCGDETQHQVTLTCGFYIGATEVTVGQFERIMGYNPNERCNSWVPEPNELNQMTTEPDEVAAECVSWEEAMDFCRRMSDLEGLPAEAYRLPTEAEWEYAARAGTTTRFWYGDLLECLDWVGEACVGFEDYEFWSFDQSCYPCPAGQKKPNPWGLSDVHGNVGEWVLDWAAPYPEGEVVDPVGPDQGERKVARGGGHHFRQYGRSAARNFKAPTSHIGGFRMVRSLCHVPGLTE